MYLCSLKIYCEVKLTVQRKEKKMPYPNFKAKISGKNGDLRLINRDGEFKIVIKENGKEPSVIQFGDICDVPVALSHAALSVALESDKKLLENAKKTFKPTGGW